MSINTLPSTTSTSISIKHGTEGPKYDPYSYTEITVNRNGHTAVLRSGLMDCVQVGDESINLITPLDRQFANDLLFSTIGMDLDTILEMEEIINKQPLRCRCGKPKLAESSGFAGETITYCKRCGDIIAEGDPTPYII